MAKAELDMVRDILGWPVSDERKLGLIRPAARRREGDARACPGLETCQGQGNPPKQRRQRQRPRES